MFLYDWFWSVLTTLGLYGKSGKIVFLGLDNAGKTTLMRMLRDNTLAQHMPTQAPTMEELSVGGIRLQAFDLGGHTIARRLWREYSTDVDGIVFLVDATDRLRFSESATELQSLLEDEEMANIPFLILGNKIDADGAVSEEGLRSAFGLYQTYGKGTDGASSSGVRPIEIFMCSIVRRQGYKEGFTWLSQFIQ